MLDLTVAKDNVKNMLFIFRYFYSSQFRINIVVNSENWDLTDEVKDADIMSLLKKDINKLKGKYNIYKDDHTKLDFAINKFNELYKLKYDDPLSFVNAFKIVYKTMNILVTSCNILILKWFIVSFFEKYLQVVSKAYDIYCLARNDVVLDINDNYNLLSTLTSDIIKKKDLRELLSIYYCISEFIVHINKNPDDMLSCASMFNIYYTYLRCSDNYIDDELKEFKEIFDTIERDIDPETDYNEPKLASTKHILDEVLINNIENKPTKEFNNDKLVITGDIPLDRSKFVTLLSQTVKIIYDNENGDCNFTISPDFKMYFITNKDEYKPIFINSDNRIFTVINYEGDYYLLYMIDNDKSVYGSSLSNWYNEPNKILKVDTDPNGEYVFHI